MSSDSVDALFLCLSKRNPTHSNRSFTFVVQWRPSTHPIHGGLVLQTCKLCYSRKKGTRWFIWGMRGPQHHQIWKQGGWETQSKEQPLTHEPRETLPQPDETSVSFVLNLQYSCSRRDYDIACDLLKSLSYFLLYSWCIEVDYTVFVGLARIVVWRKKYQVL